MRSALISVAAAVALCACGAVGGGTALPSTATPSIEPWPGFEVVVTEKTPSVSMRVGQKLEVLLHARPGMTTWSGVRSGDPSMLKPIVNPAATAARGVTLAAFQAIAPGKTQITAIAGADCSPGQACPMYAMLLTIDVMVSAG